jgi:hypothetical protein
MSGELQTLQCIDNALTKCYASALQPVVNTANYDL